MSGSIAEEEKEKEFELSMWAQKDEKDFWLQWLNKYRNFRCLWENETKRKSSRAERQAAYQELAQLAKVINPAADINFVRSRINAFRTCYRREYKKLEAARQNGIEYKPQLFYFEALKFVNTENSAEEGDESYTKIDFGLNSSADDDDPISQRSSKTEETAKRLTIKKEAIRRSLPAAPNTLPEKRKHQIVEQAYEHSNDHFEIDHIEEEYMPMNNENATPVSQKSLSNFEDEYDIFGKRIAAHFRNMQPSQRLLAEKIISDVCIFARMERLTLQSSVMVVPQQNIYESKLVETPTANSDSVEQIAEEDNLDYDDPDTYIYTS